MILLINFSLKQTLSVNSCWAERKRQPEKRWRRVTCILFTFILLRLSFASLVHPRVLSITLITSELRLLWTTFNTSIDLIIVFQSNKNLSPFSFLSHFTWLGSAWLSSLCDSLTNITSITPHRLFDLPLAFIPTTSFLSSFEPWRRPLNGVGLGLGGAGHGLQLLQLQLLWWVDYFFALVLLRFALHFVSFSVVLCTRDYFYYYEYYYLFIQFTITIIIIIIIDGAVSCFFSTLLLSLILSSSAAAS